MRSPVRISLIIAIALMSITSVAVIVAEPSDAESAGSEEISDMTEIRGYIRLTGQLGGIGTSSSANFIKVVDIVPGETYNVVIDASNRFRVGTLPAANLVSDSYIGNFWYSPLDDNAASFVGHAECTITAGPDDDMLVIFYYTATSTISKSTIEESLHVYRSYTICDVSFDVNGGSGAVDTISAEKGTGITIPEYLGTRIGHTFAGWSDGTATYAAGQILTATSDVSLEAQWIANTYAVSFVTGNGSTIDSLTVEYGEVIAMPTDPEREGCMFAGWSPEVPDTMPAEDLVFTAQWTIAEIAHSFSLTFSANGGSYAPAKMTAEDIADTHTFSIPSNMPVYIGYTFMGWSDTSDGMPSYHPGSSITVSADSETTLYAIWVASSNQDSDDSNSSGNNLWILVAGVLTTVGCVIARQYT